MDVGQILHRAADEALGGGNGVLGIAAGVAQCDRADRHCAVGGVVNDGGQDGSAPFIEDHLRGAADDACHQGVRGAQVDADRLQFPLTLRRWREGDSFVPFGMTGRKKVSDFLIDAKVSVAEKQRQFVLVSGDEIVWLVGRRIDDRYRLTPDTENVLRITKEIV